jgi:hypothetical protein
MTKAHKAHCKAKTAKGERCRMAPLIGSEFCFNHDPGKVDQRARARTAGGLKRHSPHGGDLESLPESPRAIPDLFTILDYALDETYALDNGVQRNSLIKSIVSAYLEMLEKSDFEKRLAALEDRAINHPENSPR